MDCGSYIKADYKPAGGPKKNATYQTKCLWLPLSVCTCGILGVVVLSSLGASPTHHTDLGPLYDVGVEWPQQQAASRVIVPLAIPKNDRVPSTAEQPRLKEHLAAADQALLVTDDRPLASLKDNATSGEWHEVIVEKGDTVSSIFSRLNIYRELEALMDLGAKTTMLGAIYPGQNLHIRISDHGMEELIFDPDEATRLNVVRTVDGGLEAELHKLSLERRVGTASGTIDHSLYMAGANAGLSGQLIMKLAQLFAWDIDFALDIRKGDSFAVIYEEFYRNDEKVDGEDIVAAEFTNRGQVFRVLRYTDSKGRTGYYTPDGLSVRRPFLRTPVEIARISSHFNLQRRHPILNTIRAHRGVDYAAPTGTPIKATAGGLVVERGTIGGYGRTIVLSHGSKYTTLYGHMSGYAGSTAVGQRVQQGQIIGYIGSTGLATGPHLHYEFRINGVHHDPVTVALPAAQRLVDEEMAAYLKATDPLRTALDAQVRSRIAMK